MKKSTETLDLGLWLEGDLIRRQNILKEQFIEILEEVANAFPAREFETLSPRSRGSKVSKGNDLLGLPYQVLDLIRDFDAENGTNVRLLNWFGQGFYISVLLGKHQSNPLAQMLERGFSYCLGEDKWDYPDLIIHQNHTTNQELILRKGGEFHLWVKPFPIQENPKKNILALIEEIKKIIGILRLTGGESRI